MQFIELFAGAGGMGLGLHAAGMGHEISIEKEEAPHSVLLKSGKTALRMDLRDVGGFCNRLRHSPDLIAGGPPCQDFSKAGLKKVGERAYLTQHFAQIICLVRPEWFIFENVEGAAKSKQYQYARALWKRHGYGLTELVMDAQFYGVPQRRKRFFCIGRLDEIDQFLLDEIEAEASPKPMVIRDMLDPKRFPEDAELLKKGAFFARPWMGKKDEPNGRGVFGLDEVCPTIARNTSAKPGESYIKHPKDSAELEDTHFLTTDQAARIQGFPPTYDFQKKKKRYARGPGSGWTDAKINLMIANAVPAPMAHAIGKAIYERHYGFSQPVLDDGFTAFIPEFREKEKVPEAVLYNTRSMVNRARKMVGARVYANLALELQALELSTEIIWEDKKKRRSSLGKKYVDMPVGLRSDMRIALEMYHAYILKTRKPSEWAPSEPKKATVPDFKNPPKPKRQRKMPPPDISFAEPEERERQVITWTNKGFWELMDPERAYLGSLVDDDFVPPHDPFEPQPPAGDPDELWRPEGYDDPTQDPDYLEYLESLKGKD